MERQISLCWQKKSVFRRDLFSIGLLKVGDLLSCNNTTAFSFTNILLDPEQSVFFFFFFFIDFMAHNNKRFFVTSINFSSFRCSHHHYRWKSLTFSDVSSEQIYRQFQAKKQGLPTAQKQLSDKYPHSAIDCEKVYYLPFSLSMESKHREFQYKVLRGNVH